MDKQAKIVKRDGKYILYTKDGSRILGKHDTRQGAIKQEYAIQKSQEKSASEFLGNVSGLYSSEFNPAVASAALHGLFAAGLYPVYDHLLFSRRRNRKENMLDRVSKGVISGGLAGVTVLALKKLTENKDGN